MKKRDVVEQIANEIIGYQCDIEDGMRSMRNSWDGSRDVSMYRESIIANRQALKALRNLAKKLGIYEEVLKADV